MPSAGGDCYPCFRCQRGLCAWISYFSFFFFFKEKPKVWVTTRSLPRFNNMLCRLQKDCLTCGTAKREGGRPGISWEEEQHCNGPGWEWGAHPHPSLWDPGLPGCFKMCGRVRLFQILALQRERPRKESSPALHILPMATRHKTPQRAPLKRKRNPAY